MLGERTITKIEAFILGMIQGLTEFLPISSTGHLYLGRHLFGLDEAGLFLDTMLHIGTLLDAFVIGTVSSALFGYIAVRWMINY